MTVYYPVSQNIYKFLENTAGAHIANGDYSGAAETFYFQDVKRECVIHRMIVSIEDTSGFVADEYGNLGSALGNGVHVLVSDANDEVLCNLTDGNPIKTSAQWGKFCYDVTLKSWGSTPSNEFILVRWTFAKAGTPLFLRAGDKMKVVLNDNLSGLVSHTFQIQGHYASWQDGVIRA